jgi:two-component system nitrogen regulation sensor histidine kinase NtrY
VVLLASLTASGILIQQLNYPGPIVNNLLVLFLVNVNIILLMVLMIVVIRNLAKLYFERKNNTLGAKFQTKLIVSFILLSFLPSLLLFVVASNLITQSIAGWFNVRIERSLQESLEVAQAFYDQSIQNSQYFAEQISEVLTDKRLLREPEELQEFLRNKQREFNLGLIEVYTVDGELLSHSENSMIPTGEFELQMSDLLAIGKAGDRKSFATSTREGDLVKAIVPIHSKWETQEIIGILLVDYFIDGKLASKRKSIRTASEEYEQLKILSTPIRFSYLLTFFLITLLVLFSAIWFGMHLARGMTIPIQQLAIGTKAVGEGDLEYQVDVVANDEIGILVDSFNQMTQTLKTTTNALTERQRYIETVLENITTGVVSITPRGYITTFNRAASRILQTKQEDVLNLHYRRFLDLPEAARIFAIVRNMGEQGQESYEDQLDLKLNGKPLSLLVNVTTMYDEHGKYIGTLIVFDDLTQLLRAQRIAAWREVARRLAHEIKNPLTPLQLSAQRLRRQAVKKSSRYEEIFEECTQTIIDQVDGLRHLVDEFSRFARMPAMVKHHTDLHEMLKATLSSYCMYYKHIKIRARFSREAPMLYADGRQLKQVFVNLLDNAIQAMNETGEISVQTYYDALRNVMTVHCTDSGPGIPDDLKERLFIPYFSTKGSGRGLGLAIVHRIISEHAGMIKVEDNIPQGTRFIIELPAPQQMGSGKWEVPKVGSA